mgnify:CR=1 FL=1
MPSASFFSESVVNYFWRMAAISEFFYEAKTSGNVLRRHEKR